MAVKALVKAVHVYKISWESKELEKEGFIKASLGVGLV